MHFVVASRSISFSRSLISNGSRVRVLLCYSKGIWENKRNMASVAPLVSCSWLQEKRTQPSFVADYRILDGTFDLKAANRDFEQEHHDCRIPNSRRFDINECADKSHQLAHMLPSQEVFSQYVSNLGIGNQHHVVVYDNSVKFGHFSAARVWWMFRIFGHDKVSVLDGGLPKWIEGRYETCSGPYGPDEVLPAVSKDFKSTFRSNLVTDLNAMLSNAMSESPTQVMDARPQGRFIGTSPEPRPGIPSGHIPGTINVPFYDCIDMDQKIMKSKEELLKTFSQAGIDLNRDVISTCGSGVTAAVLALAANVCTGKEVTVYDGSWVEWASSELIPPDMIIQDTDAN